MSWLSFRTKLLLATMVVVAGVTGTTLFVTQQRVQRTYQRMWEEQFDAQIQFFLDIQRTRLNSVAERCDNLASAVRVRAALEEGDADLLYESAADELREVLRRGPRSRGATFFRFLNAEGRPIFTDNVKAGMVRPVLREALRAKLAEIVKIMSGAAPQETGFLATGSEDARMELQEVIFTKVIDPTENRTLGALVLAFPVPELFERRRSDNDFSKRRLPEPPMPGGVEMRVGLWVGGELYASTNSIPNEVRTEVVSLAPRAAADTSLSLTLDLHGTPHRLFSHDLKKGSSFPPAYLVCLYSLGPALREQNNLKARILAFGFLGLLGGLGFSLALAHGLSVPVRELAAGTDQIRRGDYQVRVPVRSRDDLGRLANSFNEMAEGLAQKEKFRTLLNQVADEQIAQRLIEEGGSLGGQRRHASVLFCDIRGFTPLTESMAPEEVIELLNDHMTAMARVVKAQHGVVDKFVGDLIMGIFGAPLSHGQDALAAASCALGMIRERERLNRSGKYSFGIGIGVATGEMVAGCMGSADRLNYTVLGPRVNLASRLCSQAKFNSVVIDAATLEQLGPTAQVESLPPLTLKGFSEPVQAFRLLALPEAETPGKPGSLAR